MKKVTIPLFTLTVLATACAVLGQDTNIIVPPVVDPVKGPLPTSLIDYWAFAWPVVTALLTAGLKKLAPSIPRRIIPFIPAALGIVLGIVMQLLVHKGITVPGTVIYGLLGGAGTWLRETVDQNVVQPNTPPDAKIAELNAKIAAIRKNPKATS